MKRIAGKTLTVLLLKFATQIVARTNVLILVQQSHHVLKMQYARCTQQHQQEQ